MKGSHEICVLMSDKDKFTILESPMKRDEANMDKNLIKIMLTHIRHKMTILDKAVRRKLTVTCKIVSFH